MEVSFSLWLLNQSWGSAPLCHTDSGSQADNIVTTWNSFGQHNRGKRALRGFILAIWCSAQKQDTSPLLELITWLPHPTTGGREAKPYRVPRRQRVEKFISSFNDYHTVLGWTPQKQTLGWGFMWKWSIRTCCQENPVWEWERETGKRRKWSKYLTSNKIPWRAI